MKTANSKKVIRIVKGVSFNVILLAVMFVVNSCKHDNFEGFVGPSHCVSDNFAYTSNFAVSTNSIDLNMTTLSMTASFNEVASWTITISGQTSGAVKVFTGKSNTVNAIWRGEAAGTKFFQAEPVTVEFKVPCKDAIVQSVTVTNANTFTTFGALISDFEGNGMVSNVTTLDTYNATGWSEYTATPNTITQFQVNTDPGAVQGLKYLTYKGLTDAAAWFQGGFYATISLSSLPTNNKDSIYFNALIKGNGNGTTLLGITVVAPGPQKMGKNIKIDWQGWKWVSFKMSEATDLSATPISDMYNANAIDFGFNSIPTQGQPQEANIDFIIFTVGKPFYE
ncbi:MAG: hypothetical protein K2X86_02910 [Cytophagaceae bacterium]|nr:hypothetical protein [Cytophagaceae bacterium]